jgi:hypothetical protein
LFFVVSPCFVTIKREMGSNLLKHLHQQQKDAYRSQFARFMAGALILSAITGTTIGCSSGQAPLVIHMYNPKTHQALVCSARDQRAGADPSLLAGAVETCARNLEVRGFIREK